MLTHEEVINKLDDETVSYDVSLGNSNLFTDVVRITIKVENKAYETAVSWMKDLVYGCQFDKERLQVAVAKIQQSLPEMKRSGSNVLGALWADMLYDKSSTSLAGSLFAQMDFIPKLSKQLQEEPEAAIADFEAIRKTMINPAGIRFSVSGNVHALDKPRSVWGKHFSSLPVCISCNMRVPTFTVYRKDLWRRSL